MKNFKRFSAIAIAVVLTAVSVELGAVSAKKVTVNAPKTISATNTAKGVKVKWSKVAGATKYVVVYKVKGSSSKFATAYKGTKTSFVDNNLNLGKTYSFKVKAYKGAKKSKYSKVVNQMYLETPQLNAEELIDFQGITLEWESVKGAKKYKIYRSLKKENTYSLIATVSKGTKLYKDMDVESIESYKYYIVAVNGSYKSSKSNVDSDVYVAYPEEGAKYSLTISKGEVYTDFNVKLYKTLPYSMQAEKYIKSWSSSNKKIFTVTNKGIITGVSKGKAVLTVKGSYGEKKITAKINVTVK